jgi:hypothetical protein
MPDRIIRESALTSESLARVSDFAERLFFRLTIIADDYGRFNGNVSVIRGRCMPIVPNATEKRIESALEELVHVDSIRLYDVEAKRFGHFVKWTDHQRTRQGKPKFPEPPPFAASRGESPQVAAQVVFENGNENGHGNGATKPKLKRSEKTETLFPEGFELTPALREYVSKKNRENNWHLDAQAEFEKFRLYAIDRSTTHKDWSIAFQRWILNADRFSSKGTGAEQPGSWGIDLKSKLREPERPRLILKDEVAKSMRGAEEPQAAGNSRL